MHRNLAWPGTALATLILLSGCATSVQPPRAWNLFDPDVLRWMLERKFSLDLLRQFSELRIAIEPMAAMMAARAGNADERPCDLFLGQPHRAAHLAHRPLAAIVDHCGA